MFLVREECRRRRILDVRAAELQEEMAEQRSSVPPDPTKTAATQRTSQRAERAIKRSAMREQLTSKTGLAYDGGRAAALLRWMKSGAEPSDIREHLGATDRAGK